MGTWRRISALGGAALVLTGCPPAPEDLPASYEDGIKAGYADAQADIAALRFELESLTGVVGEHDVRITAVEESRADLEAQLAALPVQFLNRDDLVIYPNVTESGADAVYTVFGVEDGWVQVPLLEVGCRYVYVKVKVVLSSAGALPADRAVWYAPGNVSLGDVPEIGVDPPFGGRGALLVATVDPEAGPRQIEAYAWIDLEGQRDLFVAVSPDTATNGPAVGTGSVAHLGCIR